MEDNPIPGESRAKGVHKNATDEKSSQEGKYATEKHIGPSDGNRVENSKSSLLLFSVIAALFLVFWLLADFVDRRGHFNLYALFFWLAIVSALLGVVEGVEKTIGCPKWGWILYSILCIALVPFVYNGSRPLLEKPPVPVAERQEDPYSGILEPSNDPLPPFPSGLSVSSFPPDSIFLFAGSCVYTLTKSKSVCLFSHKGDCIMSLAQQENGDTAFISGSFFDEDGKLVAELISNRFDVALPPTTFRVYRPNKSTLIVRDGRGNEELNLKYLNHSAFEITGVFRLADKTKFTITSQYISPGGGKFSDSLFYGINVNGRDTFLDF